MLEGHAEVKEIWPNTRSDNGAEIARKVHDFEGQARCAHRWAEPTMPFFALHGAMVTLDALVFHIRI